VRWLSLAGGLAGALLVIRPGADDFNWAALLPVVLVVFSAVFQLLTSYLSQDEEPGTTNFCIGAVATALATLALPFGWVTPATPTPDAWSLAGIGLIALCGVITNLLKGPKPGLVESEPALQP
jgi:drug/metabolite transporter (DMT)-like permease